jgi:hypothetical protein
VSDSTQNTRTPTQDELEQWVVTTCRSLGLEEVGIGVVHTEAGATSLTAIRLISQAEEEFGEDALLAEDLFARSSVRGIAAALLSSTRA